MDPQKAATALRKALDNPIPDAIRKAFTSPSSATTGLAEYNLEQGARLIFPIDTPLRNMIPREVGQAGTQANWRAITAVNPNAEQIGVSEGNRGGFNSYTEVDKLAKFVELGLEDYVTWKANAAAGNFQNLDELAVMLLLQATMEAEEKIDLGGFGITKLGATGAVTTTVTNSGGAISAGSLLLTCVPLTHRGYPLSSVAGGVKVNYTRTNADSSTDLITGFYGPPSANAAATTSGGASVVTGSVTPIPGAAGYAWYLGVSGSQLLAAITTINSVSLAANAAGTQNLTAVAGADTSNDALVYDGLIAQCVASGSGAYIKALATGTVGTGSHLTSAGNGTGRIVEFDALITDRFTNYRLIPDTIWISGLDQNNISALILAGNTNAVPFFMGPDNELQGGAIATSYINPIGYGLKRLAIKVHPFLPQGTILFTTSKVPYALSNVKTIMKKNLRRDYYSILWALRTRKYEYGVYFDGVLQHYFPASMGIIYNIAP